MKTIQIASNQFSRASGCAARTSLTKARPDMLEETAIVHGWYVPLKAVLDCLAAGVLLVVAIPIILACALAVVLTSKGGAFYRQRRVGKNGREFTLIKLRTMRKDAESLTGPVWSVGADPRVTRVGRFLRDTHLDELPQLFNVLLGQMSLVGPRPERPPFVVKLRDEIPCYEERVRVRPGITGLSQMRLPADSDLESVRRKLVHDLYYVKHLSPWLDLLILGYTAAELMRSIAGSVLRVFTLPAQEIVERDFYPLVHQDFRKAGPFGVDEEINVLERPARGFQSRHRAEVTTDRVQAPI